MLLKSKWFSDPNRSELKNIIDHNIERETKKQTSLGPYNQEDKPMLYGVAISSAQSVFYHYLRYLLVDPTGIKPWLVKDTIDKPLSKTEFIAYNEKILRWVQGQTPSPHYTGLAHIAAVINLMVKMEIE